MDALAIELLQQVRGVARHVQRIHMVCTDSPTSCAARPRAGEQALEIPPNFSKTVSFRNANRPWVSLYRNSFRIRKIIPLYRRDRVLWGSVLGPERAPGRGTEWLLGRDIDFVTRQLLFRPSDCSVTVSVCDAPEPG